MSTVTVNLTRRDLIEISLRSLLTMRHAGRTFVVVCSLVAVYIFYTRGVPTSSWNWFALLVAGVGGAIGALAIGFCMSVLGVLMFSGKAPGVLGLHEYTFVEDGLLEKTDANETLIKWKGAHAVTHTASCLQIEIMPGLMHIVPRRAFPDEHRYAEFCEKAVLLARKHA